MRSKEITTVDLFIASAGETKVNREKIESGLKELSSQHEATGFVFQPRWWEDESFAYPVSQRSQDNYNKLIDKCDMVAVVIKNTLGKYTTEEFTYAVDLFKKTGKSPKLSFIPCQPTKIITNAMSL